MLRPKKFPQNLLKLLSGYLRLLVLGLISIILPGSNFMLHNCLIPQQLHWIEAFAGKIDKAAKTRTKSPEVMQIEDVFSAISHINKYPRIKELYFICNFPLYIITNPYQLISYRKVMKKPRLKYQMKFELLCLL